MGETKRPLHCRGRKFRGTTSILPSVTVGLNGNYYCLPL